MNKRKLTILKAILLTSSLMASGWAAADMTGTWNLTVQTEQGTGNPSFTLVEEGGKLSGTYTGMMGTTPVTGTVENDTFKIAYTIDAQGQSVSIAYEGAIKGDTIEGKMDMAGMMGGTFTGKKQ